MKKILSLFLIFTLLLTLGACSLFEDVDKSNTPSESVSSNNTNYTSITVDFTKAKTSFTGNDSFSYDGIIVYGVEENNNKTKINSSKYSVELQYKNAKVTKFSEEGTYKVAISYVQSTKSMFQTINNTLGCSYNVTYTKASSQTPTVTYSSIEIDTTDVKISYHKGETLNLTGLVVKGVVSQSNKKDITNYTTNLLDSTGKKVTSFTTSGSYTVEVVYETFKKTFIVTYVDTINPVGVTFDTVDYDIDEILYIENGSIDFSSYKAKLVTETDYYEIPTTDIRIVYFDENDAIVSSITKEGTYKIRVIYTGSYQISNKNHDYTVSVINKDYLNSLLSLEVTNLNQYYTVNPDFKNVTFTVNFKDGIKKTVTLNDIKVKYLDDKLEEVTTLEINKNYTVVFSYYSLTQSKTITVNSTGLDETNMIKEDKLELTIPQTFTTTPDYSTFNIYYYEKGKFDKVKLNVSDCTFSMKKSNGTEVTECTESGNYTITVYYKVSNALTINTTVAFTYTAPQYESLNVTGVNTKYTELPDFSNIVVKGVLNNVETTIDSSKYTIEYKDSNDNTVELQKYGNYKLVIKVGSVTKTIEFRYGPEVMLTDVSIDGYKNGIVLENFVKTSDLVVKGLYDDETTKTLETTDYTIYFKDTNGNKLDEIKADNKYQLVISLNAPYNLNKTIEVELNLAKAGKKALTISYISNDNQTFESQEVIVSFKNISLYQFKAPEGYAVAGLTEDYTRESILAKSSFTVQLIKMPTTGYVVSFVNKNYKYSSFEYGYGEFNLPENVFSLDINDGDSVSCNRVCRTIELNPTPVDKTITFAISDGLLTTNFGITEEIFKSELYLYKNSVSFEIINDLNYKLINCEKDYTYQIKGTLITYNGTTATKYNISSTEYKYEGLTDTVELIEVPSKVEMVGVATDNMVSLDVSILQDKTPENSILSYFEVYDDTNKLIMTQDYNGELVVYFEGLEKNTNYKICPYYEAKQVSKLRYAYKAIVKDLACYVWCQTWLDPSNDVCTVKITYQNELVYAYYIKKGELIRNFLEFIPHGDLDGYSLLGTTEEVGVIEEDMTVEAVFVKLEKDQVCYVYYDDCNSYHSSKKIAKYEVVSTGSTVTEPKIVETRTIKNRTYTFVKWNERSIFMNCYYYYYNGNVKYYFPEWKMSDNDFVPSPVMYGDFYKGELQMYVDNYAYFYNADGKYVSSFIKYKLDITDKNGNSIKANIISSNKYCIKFRTKLDYNAKYTIKYTLYYDAGLGVKTKEITKIVNTPKTHSNTQYQLTVKTVKDQIAYFNCSSDYITYLYWKTSESPIIHRQETNIVMGNLSTDYNYITSLAKNTTYSIIYGYSDDSIYYYYDDVYNFTTSDRSVTPQLCGVKVTYDQNDSNLAYITIFGHDLDYYYFLKDWNSPYNTHTSVRIINPMETTQQYDHMTTANTVTDSKFNISGYETITYSYYLNMNPSNSSDSTTVYYRPYISELEIILKLDGEYKYFWLFNIRPFDSYYVPDYSIMDNGSSIYKQVDDLNDYDKLYNCYIGKTYNCHFDINKLALNGFYINGLEGACYDYDNSNLKYDIFYQDPYDTIKFNYTYESMKTNLKTVTDFDKTGYYYVWVNGNYTSIYYRSAN